ncbi:thioredoxin family protein [Moorella sp. Hama-1]|uniref:thioredoxin family protein n=1 Tax=Moorella sp. Hama-1 TaxID=2138101 RepID=UPI000D64177E|nr:thioredoxin family protein [Moorella sp. Hama-1]BCV21856.1 redox-active disulfide protein 2 [Moorella sp. Hama-1]
MEIKVLGGGCANCHKLEQLSRQVVGELGLDAGVELVTDIKQIMGYGVMSTPALVVNGKVVIAGRVPNKAELTGILTSAAAG